MSSQETPWVEFCHESVSAIDDALPGATVMIDDDQYDDYLCITVGDKILKIRYDYIYDWQVVNNG
jgi:hypothetical protein